MSPLMLIGYQQYFLRLPLVMVFLLLYIRLIWSSTLDQCIRYSSPLFPDLQPGLLRQSQLSVTLFLSVNTGEIGAKVANFFDLMRSEIELGNTYVGSIPV